MDKRTKKLMKMHKALHPIYDVDRLYVSRKEGGRGLARIENSVNASIRGRNDNINKSKEILITANRNTAYNIRTKNK